MTITRFDGPDAGETRAPAGGVPVSAEERLAALIHEARCGPEVWKGAEHVPWTDDHHEWDVATAKALLLLGVPVPTEPGAPGYWEQRAREAEEQVRIRDEYIAASGVPTESGAPDLRERLTDALGRRLGWDWRAIRLMVDEVLTASRPVPAPEPSARLRDDWAVVRAGLPSKAVGPRTAAMLAAAARLDEALAATPQDPEEAR